MHVVFDPNSNNFATVGSKHVKFWTIRTKAGEAGILNGKGEPTSYACAAYDD